MRQASVVTPAKAGVQVFNLILRDMFKDWIPAFAGMTALFIFAQPVLAQRRGDQGLGIMLGNPSGVSYKMWLDEKLALDAAAGVNQSEFDIHTTLLWHNFNWHRNIKDRFIRGIADNGDFPVYFGFGPRLLFEHDKEFGIRFPVGLSFLPKDSQWEFFGELAPVLRFTPDSGGDFDFAVGVRYYFPAIRPLEPIIER